jgi:hypothetical protein
MWGEIILNPPEICTAHMGDCHEWLYLVSCLFRNFPSNFPFFYSMACPLNVKSTTRTSQHNVNAVVRQVYYHLFSFSLKCKARGIF